MVDWSQSVSRADLFRQIADYPLSHYQYLLASKPNFVWQKIKRNWFNPVPLYWCHERNRSNVNPGDRESKSETVEDYVLRIQRTGPGAEVDHLTSEHSAIGTTAYSENEFNEAEEMIVPGGSSQGRNRLSGLPIQGDLTKLAERKSPSDLVESKTEPKSGEQLVIQPNLIPRNYTSGLSVPSQSSQLQTRESPGVSLANNNSPKAAQNTMEYEVQRLALQSKPGEHGISVGGGAPTSEQNIVINHEKGTFVLPAMCISGCPNAIEITHTVTLKCLPIDGAGLDSTAWSQGVPVQSDNYFKTKKASDLSASSRGKTPQPTSCFHTAQHVEPQMEQSGYQQSFPDTSVNRSVLSKSHISSKSSEPSQTLISNNPQDSILVSTDSETYIKKSRKGESKKCTCCRSKCKNKAKKSKQEKGKKNKVQKKPSYFCFRRKKKSSSVSSLPRTEGGTTMETGVSPTLPSPSAVSEDSQISMPPGDDPNEVAGKSESAKGLKIVRFEQDVNYATKNELADPPKIYMADQMYAPPSPEPDLGDPMYPNFVPEIQQPSSSPVISQVDSKQSIRQTSPVEGRKLTQQNDSVRMTPTESYNPVLESGPSADLLTSRENREGQNTTLYSNKNTTSLYPSTQPIPLSPAMVTSVGMTNSQPVPHNYCAYAPLVPCPYIRAVPAACLQACANESFRACNAVWMGRPGACMCRSRMCYPPGNTKQSCSKRRSTGASTGSGGVNTGRSSCLWSSCCRQRSDDPYKSQMVPCPYYRNQ